MASHSLSPEACRPCGQNHICRYEREDGGKDEKASKPECPADHRPRERGFQIWWEQDFFPPGNLNFGFCSSFVHLEQCLSRCALGPPVSESLKKLLIPYLLQGLYNQNSQGRIPESISSLTITMLWLRGEVGWWKWLSQCWGGGKQCYENCQSFSIEMSDRTDLKSQLFL